MQQPAPRRHPFRSRLSDDAVASATPGAVREENDLRLFVVSFTAFFLCFYTFLL